MPSREADWLGQAKSDLRHAENSIRMGDHEWACFAGQQAAEKAVKAMVQAHHGEAWGHSVSEILEGLPDGLKPPPGLIAAARELDRHYIPSRYPNGLPGGTPHGHYTETDATKAVTHAREILDYCEGHIRR